MTVLLAEGPPMGAAAVLAAEAPAKVVITSSVSISIRRGLRGILTFFFFFFSRR